ncbi:hypothetical protein CSE45_4301 [Citreicella sp. SE45]|nr:hypothetical protein CSE45_4301 [Citreicella sp. SE45]
MKRFLTITALSTVIATSAFAASEAEMTAISTYYPDANYETLTDQQVAEMFAIANSGKDDTEKKTEIRTIAEADNPNPATTEVNLTEYVPEWRLMEMSAPEKESIMALVNRGDDPEATRVQVLESLHSATPNLTAGEAQKVKDLVPSADLTVLTTEQIQDIRAVIYNGDENDANKKSRIDEILS